MALLDLHHAEKKLSYGGNVLLLNTGAAITPEAEAMIQALHSRSVGGVRNHLENLAKKGSDKFMSSFYVGYGHKSIGDCGTITLFIEGVSMLAAKAIQDWPLYSGQEASTRYINFATQSFVDPYAAAKFIDPVQTEKSTEVLEEWRTFYLACMDDVKNHVKAQFPMQEGEKEKIYEKAVAARAFDIMRGYLPAAASTNLAWHTNLRQAADKLMLLRHHPLPEVQDIAVTTLDLLQEELPSSFGHKLYEETEYYNNAWMMSQSYFSGKAYSGVELLHDGIDRELLLENKEILSSRPPKTELPKYLAECGTLQFGFMLDFGSFRDIQRHRAVTQRMPLVTTEHGFGEFYINELPKALQEKARAFLKKQEAAIAELNLSPEISQYYIGMGYQSPNRITGSLPALVYLVELRATRFVHQTLSRVAAEMAAKMKELLGDTGLVLHLDDDPGRFDVKRGEHDITSKE